MKVTLLTHTPEPEKVVASAARLCYSEKFMSDLFDQADSTKDTQLIRMLAKMGHESPFEHVTFTFAIDGVSRACSHQLVRHRIASYSQRSQRYVQTLTGEYTIPRDIEKDAKLKNMYESHMDGVTNLYRYFANSLYQKYCSENGGKESKALWKKALENARAILPNATCTNLIVTMNARVLMNFFRLRCCNRAQEEIRRVAWKMLAECEKVAPHIFEYSGPNCVSGNCKEGKMSCKNPYMRHVGE